VQVNKTALIRYKTINQCLRNTSRNYTLDDLIEACSQAILQIEGNEKGASKRTVQADLQLMRDPTQGYGAPIVVQQKKYYSYGEPDFSILNQQISKQDLAMLQETNEFLNQLQQFTHFEPLKETHHEINNFIAQNKAKLNSIESSFQTHEISQMQPTNKINTVDLQQKGFALATNIYTAIETEQLLNLLKQNLQYTTVKETGLPLLLNKVPSLKKILFNEKLNGLLNEMELNNNQIVNAIYYPKSPQSSFYTSPHQTITITVEERHQVEGFSGWSTREGINTVMSPLHILKNMFSVRICLGNTNNQNGGLQVIPGSHKKILTIQERNFLIEHTLPISVNAQQGDCQVVKPLILKAHQNNHTNQNTPVIQLDFCNTKLPEPLSWYAM